MGSKVAVIGGVGDASGFSEALINALVLKGFYVVAIARNSVNKPSSLIEFQKQNKAKLVTGDLQNKEFMSNLANDLEQNNGPISLYIHNAASLVLKPFLDTDLNEFEHCWQSSVKTAFIAAQVFLPKMLKHSSGTLVFTGATASSRGNAKSSSFAVAKFGLRALAQSLAREFGPQGVHVCHVIVDGVIVGKRAQNVFGMAREMCIQPEALSQVYLDLIAQHPSCWTHEIDLRPAQETF